ncbi:O-antigen ligase family protein [Ancylobacter lacus]|uniref:O-antigen ligase family protein n=1 Tax=Ancylobacter lacus TaxID=2579970 RepID=UPI001BD17EC4|nr:O-antigen ligase family protein [Ancylobacter lacus]MBS7538485.1 O-antigen ligase family protein [Ancylobacter lacus]
MTVAATLQPGGPMVAPRRDPLLQIGEALLPVGACILLAGAIIWGGATAQGYFTDVMVQLISLPLLALTMCLLVAGQPLPGMRIYLALCALMAAAPLIQMIPLPPSVWQGLPGRAFAAETYQAIGVDPPWLAISLYPAATFRSLCALLPAFAIFISTLMMRRDAVVAMVMTIVIGAVISVTLGFSQLASPGSSFKMFPQFSVNDAIGFFTGKNNFAALCYAALPLSIALTVMAFRQRSELRAGLVAAGLVAVIVLLFGVMMSRSRAGIGIGLVMMVVCPMLSLWLARVPLTRKTVVLLNTLIFIVLGAAMLLAFDRILTRIDASVGDELRASIYRATLGLIPQFLPWGSGFGTFVPLFGVFEGDEFIRPTYINHAHNDVLENLLEGGVLFAVPALLTFCAFVGRMLKAWRQKRGMSTDERVLLVMSLVSMLGLLVHSQIEYPLRTETLMTVFACCAGICVRLTVPDYVPRVSASETSGRRRRRSKKREVPDRGEADKAAIAQGRAAAADV